MSLWDDLPTTLTAFGPLSSEVNQSGGLLSRFWRRNRDDSSQNSSQKSSREASLERGDVTTSARRTSNTMGDNSIKIDSTGETETSVADETVVSESLDPIRGVDRTLSSVLSRLSNILERRTTTPQAYKDSDFKQYWMPDSSCKECYDCGDKFTTFRRRHHCRICGQIFCSRCCNQELPGKIIGYKGGIRVCTYCGKVALSALQNEPSGDLHVEKEDLRLSMDSDSGSQSGLSFWGSSKRQSLTQGRFRGKLSMNNSSSSLDKMAPFDLTPQTEYPSMENLNMDRKFLEDSVQLREMWKQVSDPEKGVETQSHRIRLRTYHKCIVGNKLVDWLLKNDRAAQRLQAVAIGQAFMDAGYLEPAGGQPFVFKDDFTLYKPSETSPMDQPDIEIVGEDSHPVESTEPEWLQQIETDEENDSISEEQSEKTDTFQVPAKSHDEEKEFEPLPRQDNHTASTQDDIITESIFTSSQTTNAGKMANTLQRGWRSAEYLKEDNEEKLAFVTLKTIHDEHLKALVSQMLYEEGLSKSWADIVLGTAQRVSNYVHPDVKNEGDNMDICKYVKYKKIPGGSKEQTCLVHGLVFTKNIAHKKMSHQLTNPSILLLKGAIEYQRVEGKFSSLEPQILQENEFLQKSVTKISSMKPKPNIVIVEKSVSRLAQEFLLQAGITLVYNVKLSVMERLERFTQASIVNSIDGIVSGPITLGFCHNFKSCHFSLPSGENKTMLCFDGCATHLGCTITLRGGTSTELKQIKAILKRTIYAAYNSQLEISLCMDEFAMPPMRLEDSDSDRIGSSVMTDSLDSSPSCVEDIVSGMTGSSSDSSSLITSQEMAKKKHPDGCGKSGHSPKTSNSSCDDIETNKREGGANDDVGGANNAVGVINVDDVPKNRNQDETSVVKSTKTSNSRTEVTESCKSEGETIKIKGGENTQRGGANLEDRFPQRIVLMTQDSEKQGELEKQEEVTLTDEEGFVGVIADLEIDIDEKLNRISGETTCLSDLNTVVAGKPQPLKHKAKPSTDFSDIDKTNDSENSENQKSTLTLPGQDDTGNYHKEQGRSSSLSAIMPLTDLSDPLHNDEKNPDDNSLQSSLYLQAELEKHYQKFRKLLNEIILSVSPFVKFEVPYLESEAGSMCILRRYFPEEIYWSCRFDPGYFEQKRVQKFHKGENPVKLPLCWSQIEVVEAHPLILCQLTELNDKATQGMIADFRARGGRIVVQKPINPNMNGKNGSHFPEWNPKGTRATQAKLDGQQMSGKKERKRDCLEFSRHQRLAVLLSSHSEKSANHPFPCLPPQVVTMDFYGSQDITLGGFLEKFCFRESYSCQPYTCPSEACDVPMLDHVRRIVHNNGAIYISLRRLKNCVPGGESAIMMWNWCRKCKQATPLVPMSMDTWHFSFAKYLELHFYGNGFTRRMRSETCNHSLHQAFSQYFGHRNIVATFKYYSISKLEVALPRSLITLEKGVQKTHLLQLKEEIKYQANKGTDMYSSVLEYVVKVNSDVQSEVLSRMVSDFITMIQNEKAKLHEMSRGVRDKLHLLQGDMSLWEPDQESQDGVNQFYYIQDDINKVKRYMADSTANWSNRLQELYSQHKKHVRQMAQTKREREMSSYVDEGFVPAKFATSTPQSQFTESVDISGDSLSTSGPKSATSGKGNSDPMPIAEGKDVSSIITESQNDSCTVVLDNNITEKEDNVFISDFVSSVNKDEDYALTPDVATDLGVSPGLAAGIQQAMVTRKSTNASINSSAESNAFVVLQLSQAADTDSVMRRSESSTTDLKELGEDDRQDERQRIMSGKQSTRSSLSGASMKSTGSYDDLLDSQQQLPQSADTRISGLKKTLTNFLTGSGLSPLSLPFDASEHHLLPTCYRVPVSVYDQEPSSIIAYALSCHDYHQKLQEIQTSVINSQRDYQGAGLTTSYKGGKSTETDPTMTEKEGMKKGGSGMLSFLRGGSKDVSPVLPRKLQDQTMDSVKYTPKLDNESVEIEEDRFSVSTSLSVGSGDLDKAKSSKQTSYHLELQFSDSTARFYCKVYFADQFQQLRKLIFPAGEDMYIRSLSRCKVWEAKGGKSGMTFCKTDDDRFLMKQMSGIEVETFEKFGPEYFQHISKSYLEQKPTALAKIVGVYRIGFRNTHTNCTLKQDVLVMENLFYNKKITQTFDLKGSMRNRLVNTSGKREDELVLLDENLLKLSVESPLYIHPHSKTVLTQAIRRDSDFLSSNLVMDYSLLVGLDDKKKELVVGIIDYIRTFTWDKKLETFLKSTGGKMPTVVSPEIYRNRFLDAMGRYFLPVPDQWVGLGKDMDIG